MSLRKSLPCASASPIRFSRSSCSWKASPAGRPTSMRPRTASGSAPAASAPAYRGLATVYPGCLAVDHVEVIIARDSPSGRPRPAEVERLALERMTFHAHRLPRERAPALRGERPIGEHDLEHAGEGEVAGIDGETSPSVRYRQGSPRRSSLASAMSSWMRAALWNSSIATPHRECLIGAAATASAPSSASTGRTRFPPPAVKCARGAYR